MDEPSLAQRATVALLLAETIRNFATQHGLEREELLFHLQAQYLGLKGAIQELAEKED